MPEEKGKGLADLMADEDSDNGEALFGQTLKITNEM